ncbi:Hypothetical protein A7982_01583 [Minicystis rosea]|nr:Hypothetical protein A7982_01583 [Minicystis rosea]
MGKLVALIRGINVGRAKRIAMADLRALVEKLGYGDVVTLLNSGNVVFTSKRGTAEDAAARIEQGLGKEIGVPARVIVVTANEVAAVIEENPLADVADDPSRLLVAVLATPADRARLAPLEAETWAPDALAVRGRIAYLWCAQGILESRLSAAFGKALKDGATTRNWATMTKLHALTREASAAPKPASASKKAPSPSPRRR